MMPPGGPPSQPGMPYPPQSQPGTHPGSGSLYVARYELLLELAAGGMGSVYVGRQRGAGGFERVVAIKRMHPHLVRDADFSLAFQEEARIASLIHHPNVVNVVDVYEDAGEHLIVMEYVEGTSVNGLLIGARREKMPIPRNVAVRVAIDALHGLHAAHEQRNIDGTPLMVVHRDVSPQNILVGVDGSVRLTDFGIARAVERLVHTSTGQLKGKLRYMSPEQALGQPIDRRADVFALGIVLWEMLSGDRFYQGDSELDVLRSVAAGRVAPLRQYDAAFPSVLDQIVAYALAPDVEQRFPTAQAFASALERYALDARDTASSADVAQLVHRLEAERVAKRRHELKEALAGKRSLGPRGLPAVQLATPTVGPSVLNGPVAQRHPNTSSAGLYVGLAALALAVGVGGGVAIYGAGKPAAAPAAQPAPKSTTVAVDLRADRPITEVRALGATNIELADNDARFNLPIGSEAVPVEIAFADGTMEKLSITPTENIATRLTSMRATAEPLPPAASAGAAPSASAPAAAKPQQFRPQLPATKPTAEPTAPALKKNPYQ
jgi:eukaryotic-like serine/threonine-protein kinase